MKYQTYTKYKPSGVEWIGDIPEGWEVNRFKGNFSYKKGKSPKILDIKSDNCFLPYLSMDYLRGHEENGLYSPKNNGAILINDRDLLLLWDGANAGEFMEGKRGYLSSTMAKLSLKNVHHRYAYYLCNSFEGMLRSLAIGMGIPHVSSDVLDNIKIPIPKILEQEKISDFLDKKTKQIDNLIGRDKRLIELLKEKRIALINKAVTRGLNENVKFKDSGVEWIGEIPEGWGVRKLKFLTVKKAQYGANSEPEVNENHLDFRYIRITDVDDKGGLKEDSFAYLRKKDALGYMLQEGDILFARSGATVGKVYYYTEQDGKCCFAGYMIRYISNIKKLIPKFLLYYSLSKSYQEWIKIISTQSTIENVSAEKYDELLLPVPTLDEQKLIINYLDKQTMQTDNHIEKIIRRINLLEEYKKSLIYNAVTGKIRV